MSGADRAPEGDPDGEALPRARVLVGIETGDDAGVYLPGSSPGSSSETAIVVTADFITPPFDDPFGYGRIAAANSLSDVYAMGGRPLAALNLCMFPKELEAAVAREILDGARSAMAESGAALLGGHTVRGPELFFGLSVTGCVDPARIWRNVGGQPGDALLLTKPLGSGLIVTGARRRLVSEADRRACADGMATLNRRAAAILAAFPVHAATDITGFGLAGHALGMARGLTFEIELSSLPSYAGALELAAAGVTCGGARQNRAAYRERLAFAVPPSPAYEELVFDPQTSGGLLCALPSTAAEAALVALREAGVPAARIGEIAAAGSHVLYFRP